MLKIRCCFSVGHAMSCYVMELPLIFCTLFKVANFGSDVEKAGQKTSLFLKIETRISKA